MALPVAFAVAVGAFTRPLALLLFLYTLGTALIGHRYWTMTIKLTAWTAFTKISALWEASCCCTLLVRENIRSMYCGASPRHNYRRANRSSFGVCHGAFARGSK